MTDTDPVDAEAVALFGNRFLTEAAPSEVFPEGGMSPTDAMRLVAEDLAMDGDPPRNLATFALRAIDRPEISRGQIYNCADDVQYSVRQWVELAVAATGGTLEIISVPSAVAPLFRGSFVPTAATIARIAPRRLRVASSARAMASKCLASTGNLLPFVSRR